MRPAPPVPRKDAGVTALLSSPTMNPRVQVGLFTEFQRAPGMDEAQAFDEAMAQTIAAEDLGFDAVWLAEIHFQKERSVLSSPLVVAATIAARTRRVRIGIAVQVLPLAHPLHLAEDVATLDHLSKGRLDFGVGRSGLPGHYSGFNIPYEESRDRFEETLDIVLKAWTEERFTYARRHRRVPGAPRVRAGPSHRHARRAAGDRGPWVSLPLRATIPEGNTVGQPADVDVGPSHRAPGLRAPGLSRAEMGTIGRALPEV